MLHLIRHAYRPKAPGSSFSKDKHLSHLSPSHASTPHIAVVAQFKTAKQNSGGKIKMSESSHEAGPQILVNGEKQEQQQDNAAAGEEHITAGSLDAECSEEEKEAQPKMQSVFQQVRNQIRSQRAPKSSILELVRKIKETEVAQVNSDSGGKELICVEEELVEMLTETCKGEMDLSGEKLCAVFEEKLEACKKALKDEFEVQISLVRKEMQAYTDQAVKDLECRMQSWQSTNLQQTHPKEQQQPTAPDKKQRPTVAPSLAARRGRVLSRTMTTIIPKTCAPVIIGPRAKSETLCSSKAERFLPRDPGFSLAGNKPCHGRNPLPPTRPPLHQRKKPIQTKAKTGI